MTTEEEKKIKDEYMKAKVAEKGQAWVDANKEILEQSWEYVKSLEE